MGRGRPRPTDRQADLYSLLRSLDLTYTATSFGDLALKAAKAGLTHEAFLYELVRGECEYRAQRRIERDLRRSKLPREKTFATVPSKRAAPTAGSCWSPAARTTRRCTSRSRPTSR